MCVYIYIFICVCIYIYIFIYVYVYIYIYVVLHIMCIYAYIYIINYICMCVYVSNICTYLIYRCKTCSPANCMQEKCPCCPISPTSASRRPRAASLRAMAWHGGTPGPLGIERSLSILGCKADELTFVVPQFEVPVRKRYCLAATMEAATECMFFVAGCGGGAVKKSNGDQRCLEFASQRWKTKL